LFLFLYVPAVDVDDHVGALDRHVEDEDVL